MKLAIKIEPQISCLSNLNINETLVYHNYSKMTIFNVMLVLEEILSNIIKYSECTKEIELKMELCDDFIHFHITDNGKQFNPVDRADPDVELQPFERPIGGLGIFITKQLVRSISYERVGNLNVLVITVDAEKKIEEQSSSA